MIYKLIEKSMSGTKSVLWMMPVFVIVAIVVILSILVLWICEQPDRQTKFIFKSVRSQ